MKYKSTRSASSTYSFEEAVLGGYAPDGGLYVPNSMPQVDSCQLRAWSKLTFLDLATTLLSMFVDEVPPDEIAAICRRSYSGFQQPVVPLTRLSPQSTVLVAELYHGPTFCFKDLGLRVLINFMAYFAKKRNQKITLIVATTGDTGPAAVRAVQDANCHLLSIVVHYPKGQISDFQRKQLTTVVSPQVKIVEFEGGGDDMDIPIKHITGDKSFADTKERLICGINSFNIGRPLAQMTHFIWTYLRATELLGIEVGDPIRKLDIVVPTGAMGNLAGGYMAKQMGIPFGIFTAGVNINDITNIVFSTGVVTKTTLPMKTTLSEAINIQLPYNLERLLFYLTGEKHDTISNWYSTLEESGVVELGETWLKELKSQFRSTRVTDDTLCLTIEATLERYGYWADPHTGVALAAANECGYFDLSDCDEGKSNVQSQAVAIMATASPCKFQYAMTKAIGAHRWQKYEKEFFPKRGLGILEKTEVAPVEYEALPGLSLDENQSQWEGNTRELILGL